MTSADRWLLPEGVEEILPDEAYILESLRRNLLDLFASWGYQQVITPLVEYLDSLLVGSSHDLDLLTFKITDQLSGRMMGIRADITPQVARIDAHCLDRKGAVRLCYADSVLHTRPRGLLASRVPIRVGAELFGHAGVEADIETICLMYRALQEAEIRDVHLVLGHVGIFRSLVKEAGLNKATEQSLFQSMQRKAYAEIDQLLEENVPGGELRELLFQLSRLSGDSETLAQTLEIFASAPEPVRDEIRELEAIAKGVGKRIPDAIICFDLCELRGYEYHTGIVFAAYSSEYGRSIAKGGRYDHIGEVFGRARPASGFDCDLKTLANLTPANIVRKSGILAPSDPDQQLMEMIEKLRKSGETVIINLYARELSDSELSELACDRKLVKRKGSWEIETASGIQSNS